VPQPANAIPVSAIATAIIAAIAIAIAAALLHQLKLLTI